MADQAEVSRIFTEYLYDLEPKAETSRVFVEYLYTAGPDWAKVSQVFVEYLYEEPSGGLMPWLRRRRRQT